MRLLPLFVVFLVTVNLVDSQALTNDVLRSIFKYADLAKVKKLTKNLNRDKTVADQKKRVDTWSGKNFLSSNKSVKPPAKDPYSKKEYAVNKANELIDHRNAVEQYVQNMYTEISKKFVKEPVAKEIKKLYWTLDKTNKNDYTKTYKEFLNKLDNKLPKEKQGKAGKAEIGRIEKDFYKKNPKLEGVVKQFKL